MIINQFGGGAEKVLKTEIFTQSGTWTCPAGVEKAFVRLFGGGGSGYEFASYHVGDLDKIGPGGGGGCMAYSELAVTPGTAYPVTIGAGGKFASNKAGSGGVTSFGTLLSANGGSGATGTKGGSGGSGGGGCTVGEYNKYSIDTASGGDGTQFGGGGGGNAFTNSTYYEETYEGGNGGNGGTYGGGGGAGVTSAKGSSGYDATPGTGGTYGGNGGKGYSNKSAANKSVATAATKGKNGTNTVGIEKEFPGSGQPGNLSSKGHSAGSGGGGYGGTGGDAGGYDYGLGGSGGGGGGGGYGANGGHSCGGGGGYGLGRGGNGITLTYYDDSNVWYTATSGGGGGGYGSGGDGFGGDGSFGGGGGGGGNGGSGICIIQYYVDAA